MNVSEDSTAWKDAAGQVEQPAVVDYDQSKSLPFKVVEATFPGRMNDQAFAELVGMHSQQAALRRLSALMWKHWRNLENRVRMERRQRIALILFTGDIGTGKTAHAKALADFFGIPCVYVNSGNATFVSSNGHSMMGQVLDYSTGRGSAVILLDEVDVYANDQRFMAELKQAVDGTANLPDDGVLYVVATTNKPTITLPDDFLQRVVFEQSFNNNTLHRMSELRLLRFLKEGSGFKEEQCKAFWMRNACCLNPVEQNLLAISSSGCAPRDLQIWVQKVLIDIASQEMSVKKTATGMQLPTLKDFMNVYPLHCEKMLSQRRVKRFSAKAKPVKSNAELAKL